MRFGLSILRYTLAKLMPLLLPARICDSQLLAVLFWLVSLMLRLLHIHQVFLVIFHQHADKWVLPVCDVVQNDVWLGSLLDCGFQAHR